MLAAAQGGKHNEKRQSWGHAIIIDPWGVVLADAGGMDDLDSGSAALSPKIITADLDMTRLEEIRQKMPVQSHRRRDIFVVEA